MLVGSANSLKDIQGEVLEITAEFQIAKTLNCFSFMSALA